MQENLDYLGRHIVQIHLTLSNFAQFIRHGIGGLRLELELSLNLLRQLRV